MRSRLYRPELVAVASCGDPHATVPMSAYYLAHLIAAVHDHPRTGDWWWEVQYKFRAAHIALGEPELCDNDGNIWTFNDATPGGEVYTKS